MKQIDNKNVSKKTGILIYLICITSFLFFPTNGGVYTTVGLYLISFLILIYLLFKGKVDIKNFLIWVLLFLILFIYTGKLSLLPSTGGIRLGVMLQYLTFFLLAISVFPNFTYHKGYYRIFVITNTLMILWGFGLVFSIPFFKEFTMNYLWGTPTIHMINANKPILSFGVHSIAAFFLCQMFFLNYITIKLKNNSKRTIHLLFMMAFLILCIFLRSTSSLLFVFIMIIFIFKISKKPLMKIIISSFLLLLISYLYNTTDLYNEYIEKIFRYDGFGGISDRYSGKFFDTHLNFIKENGYIGLSDIGFIYNTDSGYIINFMRGGILSIILFFASMARFFLNNTNLKYSIYALLMILAFDSITTMLMFPRIVAFIIFSIVYLNIIRNDVNIKKTDY